MDREQIHAMLREYRARVGRCAHIDTEIRRLEGAIERERAQFERDLAAPTVSRLDGMPRGGAGDSRTERIALSLADGSAFAGSEAQREVRRLESEIARLRRERAERQLGIEYVDSWLSGLPERERWVIERHLIDGEIWHDIITEFNARFTDAVSRDRLKRIQQRALEKIYAMAA